MLWKSSNGELNYISQNNMAVCTVCFILHLLSLLNSKIDLMFNSHAGIGEKPQSYL